MKISYGRTKRACDQSSNIRFGDWLRCFLNIRRSLLLVGHFRLIFLQNTTGFGCSRFSFPDSFDLRFGISNQLIQLLSLFLETLLMTSFLFEGVPCQLQLLGTVHNRRVQILLLDHLRVCRSRCSRVLLLLPFLRPCIGRLKRIKGIKNVSNLILVILN